MKPAGGAHPALACGAPQNVLGYETGSAAPPLVLKLRVWTLIPLLESAVPYIIDGVLP